MPKIEIDVNEIDWADLELVAKANAEDVADLVRRAGVQPVLDAYRAAMRDRAPARTRRLD